MNDAGAEESPEAMAEAVEQAAMTEAQGAAATAMEAAQAAATAMANWAQAVKRWQQVASTTSTKRRDAERQSASLVKQLNGKIQEMQEQMEDRTKRLMKIEEEMKKRDSTVQTAPTYQTTPVTDNQVKSWLKERPSDVYNSLLSAVTNGKLKEVQERLKEGIDPNAKDENGNTFLHVAAKTAHSKVLQALLDTKRIQVDAQNARKQTPLHEAALNAKGESCVNILLIHKADVYKRDANGDVPLHCAARKGHDNIMEKLLKRTQVDSVNDAGQTALHLAASIPEGIKCVNLLLDKNADINKKDKKGDTPLHYAARNGHNDIVMKLIEKADLNIKNTKNETPMDVATTDVRSNLQLLTDLDRTLNVNLVIPVFSNSRQEIRQTK